MDKGNNFKCTCCQMIYLTLSLLLINKCPLSKNAESSHVIDAIFTGNFNNVPLHQLYSLNTISAHFTSPWLCGYHDNNENKKVNGKIQ